MMTKPGSGWHEIDYASRIGMLLRLRPVEWRTLAEAFFAAAMIRAALCIIPFRIVCRRSGVAVDRRQANAQSGLAEETICWAVAVAGGYVPGASCLVRALAAQRLYGRYGYASNLRIGVRRTEQGQILAHAWLERDGRVVVGGHGTGDFTAVPLAAGEHA